ncbi:hypothetical protein PV04_01543 [Phialophora macrospora]|uniref:Telomeric repeat-binding factor 2-interacting protein 1 n=1 Tax=Phialophora macrospora TaxID=1851006 RepID=A0A0D2D774_9EURO|nr:hypothetical protein PV04_01543 [Phialophora macrospora]
MSGHVVYEGVTRSRDADGDDQTLFAGQRLWFSHVIPQRRWLIENARRNGAVIVEKDTDADVRLVDHAKKNNAPGTHSYTYVESSIRNGRLERLASHAVGAPSSVSRPIGSSVTSAKGGRTPFTPADDQFLWNWLKPFVDRGGSWKGNEIYKQLEAVNPRHTFQSWRDRWIKHTQYQKRQVTETVEPEHHPPKDLAGGPSEPGPQKKRRRELDDDGEARRIQSGREERGERPVQPRRSPATTTPARGVRDRAVRSEISTSRRMRAKPVNKSQPAASKPFTDEETNMLCELIVTLKGKECEDFDVPWEQFAEQNDSHTAAEWKGYFISTILPDYCKRNGLAISQVAPFLSQEFQNGNVDVADELECQTNRCTLSDAASSQGEVRCAICFITDASMCRQNKESRILCYDCHKLVKVHGFRRASMLRAEQEGVGGSKTDVVESDGEREAKEEQMSHVPAEDNNLTVQTIPDSMHTTLLNDIVGASQCADQTSPRPRRRTKSPSFQPDSPTSTRPPESNTSRKRSAGKPTQSQSTQSSNLSHVNSQNTTSSTQSQSQEAVSEIVIADMGAEQSTEIHPQVVQPQDNAAARTSIVEPSLRASSKDKRKRLHYEATILSAQQNSSLSTDGWPSAQQPAQLISTDSDKESNNEAAPVSSPALTTPSGQFETQVRGTSPLFVPEDGDDDNIDGEEDIDIRPLQGVDGRRAAPIKVQQNSDRPGYNTLSSSERDLDEVDEDVDLDFADLVPPNKRQRSEGFETAQETPENYETAQEEQSRQDKVKHEFTQTQLTSDDTFDLTELPDPQGGFEAYGVDTSVMPPDDEHNDAVDSLGNPAAEEEQSEESPEIKIEDETWLKPRPGAMSALEDSLYLSISHADNAEEPLEGQEEVRQARKQHTKQEDEYDEAQMQEGKRIKVKRQETQRREAERREAQRQEAQQAEQEPSSTTAVPDQEDPLLTTEHPMDKWFADQRKSYATIRACEQVLLKAAESTTFNWDLATTIVPIMFSNRQAHVTRLRRQRAGKKISTAELATFDYDKFLPRDMQGVWTGADDKDLCSGDVERQDRVWRKHGRLGCDARFELLKTTTD